MALIDRDAAAHVDTSTARYAPQLSGGVPGLYAGENLDPVAPCYVNASDGKVYMSNGAANDAAAKVDGFTPTDYRAGEPVTLYGPGTRFGYGVGLAIGALYLGAAAGRLDTAATTGGTVPIAKAITSTDIVVRALVA